MFLGLTTSKKKRENWRKIRDLLETISEMQNDLKENADMFRAIFCVSPVAMLVVEVSTGLILDVNNTFTELSGLCRENVIGKTVYEVGLYTNSYERTEVVAKILDEGYIKHYPVSFIVRGVPTECFLSSKLLQRGGKQIMISVVDVAEIYNKRISGVKNDQERS